MTSIYLVRHAEAEGNLYRRVQGHTDGMITPMGKRQIDALSERFRDIPLSAVYSSDLMRARETARGVARFSGVPVKALESLREMNLGAWENRTWGEVERDERDELDNFTHDPESWSVAGGESFREVTRRITGAITELARRHDGQTIAAVSHGMAIRALLCAALNVPGGDHKLVPHGDNTCVALLRVQGEDITVLYFNDNSHLPTEISTFTRQNWKRDSGFDGRGNLRFIPLDPVKEPELYTDCYRDTWIVSHGSDEGFVPGVYLKTAKKHARENPQLLVKAMRGDMLSGIIDLDPERGSREGAGWITLIYLLPEERGHNFAIQMIGHAVTVFRKMGRRSLRLHVSEKNERAIGFYKHIGFNMIGTDEGVLAKLYLMEMPL